MERGAEQRATGATKLNELSSRSHAVFIIIVEKSTGLTSEATANGEQMAAFQGLHPGKRLPGFFFQHFSLNVNRTSTKALAQWQARL